MSSAAIQEENIKRKILRFSLPYPSDIKDIEEYTAKNYSFVYALSEEGDILENSCHVGYKDDGLYFMVKTLHGGLTIKPFTLDAYYSHMKRSPPPRRDLPVFNIIGAVPFIYSEQLSNAVWENITKIIQKDFFMTESLNARGLEPSKMNYLQTFATPHYNRWMTPPCREAIVKFGAFKIEWREFYGKIQYGTFMLQGQTHVLIGNPVKDHGWYFTSIINADTFSIEIQHIAMWSYDFPSQETPDGVFFKNFGVPFSIMDKAGISVEKVTYGLNVKPEHLKSMIDKFREFRRRYGQDNVLWLNIRHC